MEEKKFIKIKVNTIPDRNKEEETFDDIVSILKSPMKQEEKIKWCETMFDILETWYKKEEMLSCKRCKEKLIPILQRIVEKSKIELMPDFFEFYKKAYQFSARRDFETFIEYMEWELPKKVYSTRKEVLKPYVDALQRITFDDKLKYMVVSYPPSLGKSYIATLYSAWGYGLSIDNSIIRLSYSDELVLGFSRTIKGYVSSNEFADIFKNFELYSNKPFEVEKESDWKIKNARVPKSNHIARTRSGSTTGERASFAIIFDDMTKGAEEANSESTHRGIYDKWLTEWWNRRDGERCKFIFVGTQWCPEDILNRVIVDRDKVSPLKETNNPYVLESEDTIVIRVPMLDEEGKTTCPEVYPQKVAEEIRDNTDPFLFSCVYQQSPIAPTGREFAYECIRTYEELPENLTDNSFATLDTARKGKDNISMPICKNDCNGSWYLVDALFKQKPMDDLYDEIVEKIIDNTITLLVIENNIDTSLKHLLEDKLHLRGCFFCEIIEKYNTIKKEERIKNNRGIVQKQMVFPEKKLFKPNTDIGRMMDNFTKYSFDKPNVHDDACFDGNTLIATPKGNIPIKELKKGMTVITPSGISEIEEIGVTGERTTIDKFGMNVTPNHKVYDKAKKEFKRIQEVEKTEKLSLRGMMLWKKRLLNLMGKNTKEAKRKDIILSVQPKTKKEKTQSNYIEQSGYTTMGKFQKAITYTTLMATSIIMTFLIWLVYRVKNIYRYTQRKTSEMKNINKKIEKYLMKEEKKRRCGTAVKKELNGIENTLKNVTLEIILEKHEFVNTVEKNLLLSQISLNAVGETVLRKIQNIEKRGFAWFVAKRFILPIIVQKLVAQNVHLFNQVERKVYNMKVKNAGCYYANGKLVSNCDSICMVASEIILKNGALAKVRAIQRPF